VSTTEYLAFEKPIGVIEKKLADLRAKQDVKLSSKVAKAIQSLESELEKTMQHIYGNVDTWQRIQTSRHPQRPYTLDYIDLIFQDFVPLAGDRHALEDHAMVGGFAMFEGRRCMVIGQQKGRDTKERKMRNFGMANPEGYRKAIRLMRLAEKFGVPIFTFIDTPGAYPGVGAEERNIAEAIAYNLREMSLLEVPIVATVIGEGGSGGALGIGVADRMLMLENAYYSVISPEGCAAILWKDAKKGPEAAEALKMTAPYLAEMGIVDEVVKEPFGGAHRDPKATAETLKQSLFIHLEELRALKVKELLNLRYDKFRGFGEFKETAAG
jgi:acetyl-CoA carboxylase carboxyl transferase subunit alpha